MTNRDRIIGYLADHGIDLLRTPYIIEKRAYQRPGTVVINYYHLTGYERLKLLKIGYKRRTDGLYEYDPSCPIEVKSIRDHFEWKEGLNRIIWKKR